jgi:hypothetical protein
MLIPRANAKKLILQSVGIAHENGRCKPEEFSVFTRLGRYADFISRTLMELDAL